MQLLAFQRRKKGGKKKKKHKPDSSLPVPANSLSFLSDEGDSELLLNQTEPILSHSVEGPPTQLDGSNSVPTQGDTNAILLVRLCVCVCVCVCVLCVCVCVCVCVVCLQNYTFHVRVM